MHFKIVTHPTMTSKEMSRVNLQSPHMLIVHLPMYQWAQFTRIFLLTSEKWWNMSSKMSQPLHHKSGCTPSLDGCSRLNGEVDYDTWCDWVDLLLGDPSLNDALKKEKNPWKLIESSCWCSHHHSAWFCFWRMERSYLQRFSAPTKTVERNLQHTWTCFTASSQGDISWREASAENVNDQLLREFYIPCEPVPTPNTKQNEASKLEKKVNELTN